MSTVAKDQDPTSFPRFLSRDDGAVPVIVQPPLIPRPAWPFSNAVLSSRPRTFIVFAAIGVPALASAAFLVAPPSGAPRQRLVTLITVQAPVTPPDTTSAEIASAVEIVAQLETRLGYASNLSGHAQDFKMDGSDRSQEAIGDSQNLLVEPDAVPLLPVFGTQPPPVDENAWKVAASNPEFVVLTPNDETDVPTSEGALQTRAAATLSVLNLDLGSTGTRRAARKAVADASGDETESAPQSRPRAHKRKARPAATQGADEEEAPKKRVRRPKIAKAKNVWNPQEPESPDASAVADAEKDAPKSSLAKLLLWLKGKQSPPAEDDSTNRTGLGMKPQD